MYGDEESAFAITTNVFLIGMLFIAAFIGGCAVGMYSSRSPRSADPFVWKVVVFDSVHKPIESYYCGEHALEHYDKMHYLRIMGDDGRPNVIIYDDGQIIVTRLTPAEAEAYQREKDHIKIK